MKKQSKNKWQRFVQDVGASHLCFVVYTLLLLGIVIWAIKGE